MLTYNDLLIEADNNCLITKEKPLRANKGRIKGNRIAIKEDMKLKRNVSLRRNWDTTTPLSETFWIKQILPIVSKNGTPGSGHTTNCSLLMI